MLVKLAERFEEEQAQRDPEPLSAAPAMPPLPNFSAFSAGYTTDGALPDGDLRAAFFQGQRRGAGTHMRLEELCERVARGERPVSAGFVTPYPPGFPILVPGQLITAEVLDFMAVLDTREIHGYDPARGYRILLD